MYCKILKKDKYINPHSDLWDHTKMRIDNAKIKAKSNEDFEKKDDDAIIKNKTS